MLFSLRAESTVYRCWNLQNKGRVVSLSSLLWVEESKEIHDPSRSLKLYILRTGEWRMSYFFFNIRCIKHRYQLKMYWWQLIFSLQAVYCEKVIEVAPFSVLIFLDGKKCARFLHKTMCLFSVWLGNNFLDACLACWFLYLTPFLDA